MVKASFQIRRKSVGVNAHAAQALGGVSLGRLAEQQEDDQRDERDGNDRADTEGQLAGDQTADLINDGGYNVSVSTHVADCESSPLAVVHLTLDGAHCREARRTQQVECHEGICADLRKVRSQLAPDLGAVLGNLADEVIQLTEGSNNVLLCDQTGDGGNGGFPWCRSPAA